MGVDTQYFFKVIGKNYLVFVFLCIFGLSRNWYGTGVKMASKMHVVMLPWSAFGHIIPFFQLSVAIAKAGVRVSLVSTPRNIERLPKPPPNLSSLIKFVELPFPTMEDGQIFPEGAEATVDVRFEKIQFLKVAFDLLQQPFKQYVADASPDWIIVDFFPHWVTEICREYGVPLVFFSVLSASTAAFLGPVDDGRPSRPSPEIMTSPPEWITFPSSVAFKAFEKKAFLSGDATDEASGKNASERYAKIVDACQAMAVRSCVEYEGEYLNLLGNLMGKPVIPVGLLPPENPPEETETRDSLWEENFKWLKKQKPKSVVFVGFGSECKLTKDQVHEIAYGLELSELPFLWSLRKPDWVVEGDDALPSGFRDRTSDRGIVCIGWAPQMEILAHPSIGGSLFHSGWGSIIETLQFGHCLVVLPFIYDQGLNARLAVEKGLAVEIERGEDGSFRREDIAKSLRFAMVSEDGEKMRMRAREAAAIFGDRKLHQDHYIREFVEYLKNGFAKQN